MGLRRSLVREEQEAEEGEHCDPAFFDLHPQCEMLFSLQFGTTKIIANKVQAFYICPKSKARFHIIGDSVPGSGGERLRED